jgi:hypothetical protein
MEADIKQIGFRYVQIGWRLYRVVSYRRTITGTGKTRKSSVDKDYISLTCIAHRDLFGNWEPNDHPYSVVTNFPVKVYIDTEYETFTEVQEVARRIPGLADFLEVHTPQGVEPAGVG